MHDDDVPVTPEPWEPEPYWTEEDWEQFMIENERLMDRYEQVWKDNPNRSWDDPLDLYYKVHYDLDLGGGPASPPSSQAPEPPQEPPEAVEPEAPEEDVEGDDFRQIPVYQLAYAFSLAVLDYVKRCDALKPGQDPLVNELGRHGLRIAADIAGGHGLGYEEETLCGNIVKNRWALSHTVEAKRLLRQLAERDGMTAELGELAAQLPPIIKALEERIAELRAKVWWDR